jgi:triacylglycerol lipase
MWPIMAVPLPVPMPHIPPIWLEGRFALEMAALRRSDVWRGAGVEPGEGSPVLLIPGFLAGDTTLGTMTDWLRRNGYRTKRAGIRANVACSEAACARIEERLEAMAEQHGRVTIIGQSRGGLFAKALASQRPDLVAGIVTLGSPLRNMLAVHPLVLAQIGLIGALGSLSLPGMLSARCLRGECCTRFRSSLEEPFPEDVGYVSLYSRSDGIVDWRACLDPEADEHLEVRASHCGMSVNASAYRAVARALAGFATGEAPAPADGALAEAA